MRVVAVTLFFLYTLPCYSQWRFTGGNIEVFGFTTHDTSFFYSVEAGLLRAHPKGSSSGLDLTQGPMVSFASLGPYFFAGSGDPSTGVGAISTDNGSTWRTVAGGPVGSNGTYVYGNWGAYPDSLVSIIAISKDTGRTWQKLSYSAGMSFAGYGACVLTNTPRWGVLRSLDSGNTWSAIPAPFSYGRLVRMGTLIFLYQRYYSRQHDANPLPPHNGILVMSRDSGLSWDTVNVDSVGIPEYVTTVETDGRNLFVGGHNALTTEPNGIYVSRDTGKTWRAANDGLGDLFRVLAFGIWDTTIYVSTSNDAEIFPFATYSRSLRELLDTTHSGVPSRPTLADDTILVYPNPSSGMFTIEAPNVGLRSVVVLNLLGQELLHIENVGRDARPTRADLSALPPGTYFLRIETERGIIVRKVVRE